MALLASHPPIEQRIARSNKAPSNGQSPRTNRNAAEIPAGVKGMYKGCTRTHTLATPEQCRSNAGATRWFLPSLDRVILGVDVQVGDAAVAIEELDAVVLIAHLDPAAGVQLDAGAFV